MPIPRNRPLPAAPAALLLAVALCVTTGAQAQSLRPSGRLNAQPTQRIAQSGPLPADYIVAIVNSEPITNNEVRARLVRTEQQLQQSNTAMPPREQLARRLLEQMVNERAQLQIARENGIKIDDTQIDTAIAQIAQNNQLSPAALKTRLESDGILWAQFRQDVRDQLLLTRVRERETDARGRISDADVDQYMRDQSTTVDADSTELNLAQILIPVPESATAAQVATLKARAQSAYERAQKGEDFAALAAELSAGAERRQGGVMGLRTANRYPPLFVEATRDLATGGVSQPVRSGAGFHVLKVIDRSSSGAIPTSIKQTHARHILLRTGPKLTEAQARERLASYRQRVLAGKGDFAALAKEFSQDGSAATGGDLGWAIPGQFVPEFEDTMNRLEPGQISEPLLSRFGVHIIQVLERRDQKLTTTQQRELARNALREKRAEENFVNWAQEVRGRAYVEFREPPQQ